MMSTFTSSSPNLPILKIETNADGSLFTSSCPSSPNSMTLDMDYSGIFQDLPNISPAGVHQRLTSVESIPEEFASKLVSLHFGHSYMEVNDLTSLLLHLERRFYTFAKSLPEFQALSFQDQQSLLMANSSMYVQLHLAHYINAGNGLKQIKALLGDSTPEVLEEASNNLLTISFSYFAGILGLFNDKVYTDFYETLALKICRLDDVLSSSRAFGEVSACILFYVESNSYVDEDFDDAHAIHSAFGRHSRELTAFCSKDQLRGTMETLKSLSHLYSAHANKTNVPKYELPSSAGAASGATAAATVRQQAAADSEAQPWLKDQLSLLTNCCQDICIGSDDLIHLGLALAVEEKNQFAKDVIVQVLRKRVCLIAAASNSSSQKMSNSDDDSPNVQSALQLVLRILDSCDSGADQLSMVLGQGDRDIWDEWFRDCKEEMFKKMTTLPSSSSDDGDDYWMSEDVRDLCVANRDLVTLLILVCLNPCQEKYLSLLAHVLKESLGDLGGEKMFQKFAVLLQNVRSL